MVSLKVAALTSVDAAATRHIGGRTNAIYVAFLAAAALLAGGAAMYGPASSLLAAGALIFMLILALDPSRTSALCLVAVLVAGSVDPPRIGGVTVVNVALTACLVALLFQHLAAKEDRIKARLPVWSALLIIVLVSSSSSPQNLSSLSTPLLTAAMTYMVIRREKGQQILVALATAGLIHASVGLYESISHSSLVYTGWKDAAAADVGGIRRAASFVGDPNYLALTLLCCAPGVLFVIRKLSVMWRMVWIPYSAALILTFSRGVLLGVFLCLLFYTIKRYSLFRRPVQLFSALLAIAVGIVGFAVTPVGQSLLTRFITLDASTRSRSLLQTAALDLYRDHWLTGVGIGNLPEYLSPLAHALVPLNASGGMAFLPQTDPLNTYLLVGAEGGVLALALMIGVIITAFVVSLNRCLVVASVVLGVAVVSATLDLIQPPVVWCVLVLAINWPSTNTLVVSSSIVPEPVKRNGFHVSTPFPVPRRSRLAARRNSQCDFPY